MKATQPEAHCAECAAITVVRDGRPGCFFCGTKPLTREHILPDWLDKAIPEWNRSGLQKHMPLADGNVRFEDKSFGRSMLRNTVKVACSDCNSGWMSRLESRMIPHLSRLLVGDPMLLAGSDYDDFLRWSVKTHMMRTQWDYPSAWFPEVHRSAIKDEGRLPPGWSLWVGRTVLDGVSHRNWSAVIHVGEYPPFMVSHTTLTMGSFVLSVAYVSDPAAEFDFLDFMDGAELPDVALVRPLEQRPMLLLPPPRVLSGEECDDLSDRARQWIHHILGIEPPRLKHIDLSNGIAIPPKSETPMIRS